MLLLVALATAFPLTHTYAQKITVDEIVAKHLESIGTSADRSQVRNLMIRGDIKMAYHGYNPYKTEGKVILASGALGTLGTARGQGVSPESLHNFMKFTEEFSDFRKEGQLTLPHKYTIYVKAPVLYDRETDYTVELKEFFFNVPFDPASFNVTKNK